MKNLLTAWFANFEAFLDLHPLIDTLVSPVVSFFIGLFFFPFLVVCVIVRCFHALANLF